MKNLVLLVFISLFLSAYSFSEFENARLVLFDVARNWQSVTSKPDEDSLVLKSDPSCDVEPMNDLTREKYVEQVKRDTSMHVGKPKDGFKGLVLLYEDDSFWCGTNTCVKSELMFITRCFIKKYA